MISHENWKRNWVKNREEKENLFAKSHSFEKRKRIFFQISNFERRTKIFSSKSWHSRTSREMKIQFWGHRMLFLKAYPLCMFIKCTNKMGLLRRMLILKRSPDQQMVSIRRPETTNCTVTEHHPHQQMCWSTKWVGRPDCSFCYPFTFLVTPTSTKWATGPICLKKFRQKGTVKDLRKRRPFCHEGQERVCNEAMVDQDFGYSLLFW